VGITEELSDRLCSLWGGDTQFFSNIYRGSFMTQSHYSNIHASSQRKGNFICQIKVMSKPITKAEERLELFYQHF
jgi:hypothetical protein